MVKTGFNFSEKTISTVQFIKKTGSKLRIKNSA
jgi:hypothetical protein